MASHVSSSNYNRLVSTAYNYPFFGKSFKTPFTVSLVCMQTTCISLSIFVTRTNDVNETRCGGDPCSVPFIQEVPL